MQSFVPASSEFGSRQATQRRKEIRHFALVLVCMQSKELQLAYCVKHRYYCKFISQSYSSAFRIRLCRRRDVGVCVCVCVCVSRLGVTSCVSVSFRNRKLMTPQSSAAICRISVTLNHFMSQGQPTILKRTPGDKTTSFQGPINLPVGRLLQIQSFGPR
jgi:hypothetical protein